MKNLLIILILVLLLIGIFIFWSKSSNNSKNTSSDSQVNSDNNIFASSFDKGTPAEISNSFIYFDADLFSDNQMRFYNTKLQDDKIVYYFIVKDKQGKIHAAANACEVCFGEKKGFSQDGDIIRCNNCGTTYSLDEIAKEKGGCNPRPISPDLKIENGKIKISENDLINIKDLF